MSLKAEKYISKNLRDKKIGENDLKTIGMLREQICVDSCEFAKTCDRTYQKVCGFAGRVIEDAQFIPMESDNFEYEGGLIAQTEMYKVLYMQARSEMMRVDDGN